MSSRGGQLGVSCCLTRDSCLTSHTLPNPKLSCGHASDSCADSRHHRQALNIHWLVFMQPLICSQIRALTVWLSGIRSSSVQSDQCSLCFYLKLCLHRNIFSVWFSCTYLLSCVWKHSHWLFCNLYTIYKAFWVSDILTPQISCFLNVGSPGGQRSNWQQLICLLWDSRPVSSCALGIDWWISTWMMNLWTEQRLILGQRNSACRV